MRFVTRICLVLLVFSGMGSLVEKSFAERLTPEELLRVAVLAGDYLVHHHKDDGTFQYGYQAEFDYTADTYNHLRHAGTCYSLIELYEATREPRFLEAGRKGLEWLCTQTIGPKPEHKQEDFLAILSPDQEAKLGGAALALLAMCKYEAVTGDSAWRPLREKLCRFLLFMQSESGEFESKYFYREPDAKKFVSMYYPGEAILALAVTTG